MKKNAFTLAEVLISIGLIAVVASVTLPSLNTNIMMSRIGSKLSRAYNVIENANSMILEHNDDDDFRSYSLEDYINSFLEVTRGTSGEVNVSNTGTFPNDKYPYVILPDKSKVEFPPLENQYTPSGSFKGPFLLARVNVNPAKSNAVRGREFFYFMIDKNGTVFPYGGKVAKSLGHSDYEKTMNGVTKCMTGAESLSSRACAGAFFESDMKPAYFKK